ncbi:hypothetical protein GCM10020331_034620 [Ectobacillus funiculus]
MAKGSVENVTTVLRSLELLPQGYDVHINFPGGVPVDGPSAGIAMAVGVYSAVHGVYVKKNEIAMTGEISIHGEVKPVGGVYAKIKAAKKAGAKMVLIPAENMQPILYSIKGIEIVPVRHMKEVLARAIVSAPSSARTSIEAIQSSFNEGGIFNLYNWAGLANRRVFFTL